MEIGTGSGYQAAVLSPLVKEVYTIEIVEPLGERAARTLKRLKYANVHAKVGDGYQGWPEHAPFDKIIVTCSPEKVPPKLVEQLREGGRMIVPVGERYQQTLYLFRKEGRQADARGAAADAVRADDRQGRSGPRRAARPGAPVDRQRRLRGVSLGRGRPAGRSRRREPDCAAASPDQPGPTPDGWYYQRQLQLVEAKDAPEGKHYVTFSNTAPGRGAHALQGLAVDGRKVSELKVSLWVKAKDVRAGPTEEQQPVLAITFYDDNRAQAGYVWVGPWRDSFDWQRSRSKSCACRPKLARPSCASACSGATGEMSFDDIRIEKSTE